MRGAELEGGKCAGCVVRGLFPRSAEALKGFAELVEFHPRAAAVHLHGGLGVDAAVGDPTKQNSRGDGAVVLAVSTDDAVVASKVHKALELRDRVGGDGGRQRG